MLKSQKTNAKMFFQRQIQKQGAKMSYEEAYKMLSEMSEEERIEAFSVALGLLNEDELADMIDRCRDIIEAVQSRMQKGGVYYIE